MKILNYAINSLNDERASKLININKWIYRISAASGQNAEIYFLTSSNFGSIIDQSGFPAFTLPSASSLKSIDMPEHYKKIAKQWVWNSINLISPEVMIVDTFPNGYFNEIETHSSCKKIFIYPALENNFLNDTNFQNTLNNYDRVIIENENRIKDYNIPDALSNRIFKSADSKNHTYQIAAEILKGKISDNIIEHIECFIPEDFFHSLSKLNISEQVALRTINILDSDFHSIIKLNQSLEFVSLYFDFDYDTKTKFLRLNNKLYNNFIDYPLNNLALMFLNYIKSKDIDYDIGNQFLEYYIKTNSTVSKSIQVILMEALNYLSLLLSKSENIDNQLLKYISEINSQSLDTISL